MSFTIRDQYPLDLLPDEIREPIQAVSYLVQAPREMCGQAVVAAANFVTQQHVNVVLPVNAGYVRPVSEFFVTLGSSGERKSGVDALVLAGVKDWQDAEFDRYDREKDAAREALEVWEQTRRDARKKGAAPAAPAEPKGVGELVAGLAERERTQFDRPDPKPDNPHGDKPQMPLYPTRLVEDPTVQGLSRVFRDGYPSLGLFNDEAGQFLGGYSLGKENALHTGASLSKLWDGKPVERVRAGEDPVTYRNRRLSMHLMVQPGIATKLLENVALQEQGLCSRLLVAFPASTVGTRFHRRDPEDWEVERAALAIRDEFTARTRAILDRPAPIRGGDRQQLDPRRLEFSGRARAMWLDWTDAVERESGDGGMLVPVKPLAGKAGEHAARLAATFAAFRDVDAPEIRGDDMAAALALMEYHLGQALRIIGALPDETEESRDYEAFEAWVRAWPERFICGSNITANCRPRKLRSRKDLILKFIKQMIALGVLKPHDKPEVIKGKNRTINVYEIMQE